MEKFHFLFYLEAKTNKRQKSFFFFSSPHRWNENKQRWIVVFLSFFFPIERELEKIKYRWKNHSPKMKRRIRNVFHLRQYFFSSHLISSLGVVSSYLEWENLFFIFASLFLFLSSPFFFPFFFCLTIETTQDCYFFCILWCLAQESAVCGVVWSVFYLLEKCFESTWRK